MSYWFTSGFCHAFMLFVIVLISFTFPWLACVFSLFSSQFFAFAACAPACVPHALSVCFCCLSVFVYLIQLYIFPEENIRILSKFAFSHMQITTRGCLCQTGQMQEAGYEAKMDKVSPWIWLTISALVWTTRSLQISSPLQFINPQLECTCERGWWVSAKKDCWAFEGVCALPSTILVTTCNKKLTDLQLSGNSSFALISEVNLSLVVLCHHLYKLLGQDRMLG